MPVRSDFAPGEFCWIDLSANNLEDAAAWYADNFGWTHMVMETPGGGPPYAFMMSGDGLVAGLGELNEDMKAAGVPPMWNSYIATSDCEAMEAKVKELGGTVTVPTMEIPGHGKLAFFLDPEGASFAAWQTTNPDSPGLKVSEPVSLCWNELMTRDVDKAHEFYGNLADWQFAEMPMGDVKYSMIKNGGKDAGGMMPMEGPQFEGVPAHWVVYLTVADCDAAAVKVEATGGKVHVPPMDIPVGRFSMVCDPQGANFGIIQLAAAPA